MISAENGRPNSSSIASRDRRLVDDSLIALGAGLLSGIAARMSADAPLLGTLTAMAGPWLIAATLLSRRFLWRRCTAAALIYVEFLAIGYYFFDAQIDGALSTGLLIIWLIAGLACAPIIGLIAWWCTKNQPFKAVGYGVVAGFLLSEILLSWNGSTDYNLLRLFNITAAGLCIWMAKDRYRMRSIAIAILATLLAFWGSGLERYLLQTAMEMR